MAGVSDLGQAQHRSGHQDIIDDIIRDVVDRALDAARETVLRTTGVDPAERGDRADRRHNRLPSAAFAETRRELRKL